MLPHSTENGSEVDEDCWTRKVESKDVYLVRNLSINHSAFMGIEILLNHLSKGIQPFSCYAAYEEGLFNPGILQKELSAFYVGFRVVNLGNNTDDFAVEHRGE